MDVIQFSNPVLYNKIAQELNDELYKLGIIDDLYPVCSIGVEAEETFPEVYINDGTKKNLRALPQTLRAMSFFVVNGEMSDIDELHLSVPMGLIVWMNLKKADPGKSYDYTAEIIKLVYNVLKNYGCYDLSIDINNPFEEFSMLSNKAINMRPHSVFRVNFTKTVSICQ